MKLNGNRSDRSVGIAAVVGCIGMIWGFAPLHATGIEIAVEIDRELAAGPIDGRVVLILAGTPEPEPRFQVSPGVDAVQVFGVDAEAWKPDTPMIIDSATFGYPLETLADLPAGEYWIQALLHHYETFSRSDGHVVKLPMDRGEGQRWNRAPGNHYSTPRAVQIDPADDRRIEVRLTHEIPPIEPAADTNYIKHIRIRSKLLSDFWGRPMHLGAHVLLPEGFAENPQARYPLMIFHGHFPSDFGGFREDPVDADLECEPSERFGVDCYNRVVQQEAHDFYETWTAPDFPRFLAIEIQHANPFYDDSYAVNSANLGPYGDAITYELIPHIEKTFRGLAEPWARFLYGGSTGGWEALAAQIFYPTEYNGAFGACPDPIDFREYTQVDIYEDENAYFDGGEFHQLARPAHRDYLGRIQANVIDYNHLELVLGTLGRSGDQYDIWQAVYSPVGNDGYPQPIWDKLTGQIDPEVAAYWRDNYDLRHILARDWEQIGPDLEGKLHVYCGDMDNYYLNNAVYLMEEFLESTENPYYGGEVDYGDRAEHCWNGDHDNPNHISRLRYNSMYVPRILRRIEASAPAGADLTAGATEAESQQVKSAPRRAVSDPDAAWLRLLRKLGVDLRPQEARQAVLFTFGLFLILTFQISTKTVRQATFIDSLGSAKLPLVYLLVAVCSYPILKVYNRFAERFRIHQLLAATALIVAASLLVFLFLLQARLTWAAVAFYVGSSIVYAVVLSQFWSLANQAFDARQAKRLFGLIGTGGLLGGIAGGQLASLSSTLLGTGSTLVVAAAMLVGVAVLAGKIGRTTPDVLDRKGWASKTDRAALAKGGGSVLRGSRLLQAAAAVTVLTLMVAQIVDLQFNWVVEQHTSTLDERTAYFGFFFSVMGALAFLFQIVFTGRILRTLGISFALRVLPTSLGIGTVLLLAAAGFLPSAVITAAWMLKISESGLRFSLNQATSELLFLPVPSVLRIKAKAFINVFVQRAAKGLAALLLIPVTLGLMTPIDAGWISLVLVVAWLAITAWAYRSYVGSFRKGLETRAVDSQVPLDLTDLTTLELILESLGSSDPRQVLHSMELLRLNERAALVPPLLLYHDDAQVRLATLRVLAEAGRDDALPLIERVLADEDPDVRAAAVRSLARLEGRDIRQVMLPRLQESSPGVRAAAVACLTNAGDPAVLEEATAALEGLMSDSASSVRREAARALGAIHEPRFQEKLLRLLYDSDASVVRATISAIGRRVHRDGFNPLYVPTLVSLLQDRKIKQEAQQALVAFGETVLPTLDHFLSLQEEAVWVRRALPKVIARIGTPGAIRILLAALDRPEEPFVRRKLIQALVSIGKASRTPLGMARPALSRQVDRESTSFMWAFAALVAVDGASNLCLQGPRITWNDEAEPDLLDRLLAERMDDHLKNMFGLLALLYPNEDIWPAYYGVISPNKATRAHAVEYLDNTLSGLERRKILAVIDDFLLRGKLSLAAKLFSVPTLSKREILVRLLDQDGPDIPLRSPALTVAALYALHLDRGIEGLEELVTRLASQASDPMVKETADWVSSRA